MNKPMQPIEPDKRGVMRFASNAIVERLLELTRASGYGLNEIACESFSADDRMQFAQLIGYSLSGYGELGYVSEDSYNAAEAMAKGLDERDARIDTLQAELDAVRNGMRDAVARLYSKHPDDLMEI